MRTKLLYTASLITTKQVIPAKAGIQAPSLRKQGTRCRNTGFRVKPGMTNWITLMSSCVLIFIAFLVISSTALAEGAITTGPPITTHGYSIFDETMVDMAWPQVEKAAQEGAIILFPIGVIEEHGPHMGLGVDAYLAYVRCKLIRRELESRGLKTLIAPPFYWGINHNTGSFPGSFTVRKETMKAVLYDALACFRRWGFTYVFLVNNHGDGEHNLAILDAVKEARVDTGIRAYFLLSEFDAKVRFKLTGREHHILIQPSPQTQEPPPKYFDIHAGGRETGVMLYYFPDQVNKELAKTLKPTNLILQDLMAWDQGWIDAKKITPLGYFGDPASFDPEVGRQRTETSITGMANLIEAFLKGKEVKP
jgi:creatinine amidohydrolase